MSTLLPDGIKATDLSPLELNAYRFRGKHTPLTPAQLRADASKPASESNA